MVFEDRRFAAASNPLASGFFFMVAGIFQRRIHARRGGKRKILERSERAGTPRETRRCARSASRVEPRRLRPRFPRGGLRFPLESRIYYYHHARYIVASSVVL